MGAQITINDSPVIEMALELPVFGAWSGDFFIDQSTTISGDVTVKIGDSLELHGTVAKGGPYLVSNWLRVVGGKNGMNKIAQARHYTANVTVRTVVNDLLADAGESLSTNSSSSLLGTNLQGWTTVAVPVCRVLFSLAALLGDDVGVRILPDGSVFIGTEAYPKFSDEFLVLNEYPQNSQRLIGLLAPTLLPGQTIDDKKVTYVSHKVTQSDSTTMAWISA